MSKLQRLRDNIAAIREALSEQCPKDVNLLGKYSGFGGLGFVLNSLNPADWKKNDMVFYADTVNLHSLLHQAS